MWLRGCSEGKEAVEEEPLSTSLFCSLICLILLPDFFCDKIAKASSKIAETIPEIETSYSSELLQEWSALVLLCSSFVTFSLSSFIHYTMAKVGLGSKYLYQIQ